MCVCGCTEAGADLSWGCWFHPYVYSCPLLHLLGLHSLSLHSESVQLAKT